MGEGRLLPQYLRVFGVDHPQQQQQVKKYAPFAVSAVIAVAEKKEGAQKEQKAAACVVPDCSSGSCLLPVKRTLLRQSLLLRSRPCNHLRS